MTNSRPCRSVRAASVLLLALSACAPAAAVETLAWEQSPYRVLLTLAVDSSARPGLIDEAALATEIADRASAAIGPLWILEIDVAAGQRRRDLCARTEKGTGVFSRKDPRPLFFPELPAAARSMDKAMWLAVRAEADGFTIRCREYDVYVRHSGPLLEASTRQPRMLGEVCFDLLRRTFAPLALIDTMPDDDEHVRLTFRGSALPKRSDEPLFAQPGAVYLPLLRRTNRLGELLSGGVVPLPWTYMVLEGEGDEPNLAKVESGIRRPFSVRRRGLVEQVAIAAPSSGRPTTVRFHSRHDETLGLAGYQVFVRDENDQPQIIGLTDAQGQIEVPLRYGPAAVLYLRSDGQVLAKAPVATGATPRVEIPISDDPARLLAQARSQTIREQLVDLVARRAILSARVRARLEDGEVEEAQRLMSELASMPAQSEFNLQINAAQREREAQSDNERVQQKIDRIYADIRSLLSKFLNRQTLIELQSEVDAAARGGG